MKKLRLLFLFCFVFGFLKNGVCSAADIKSVEKCYEKMSDVERVSQLFLVNIEGNKTYRPVEFLEDGKPVIPGGVLLFSYNIAETPEMLMDFIDSIGSYASGNELMAPYVAVDQEGGEVNRLGGITSTLRSCKRISDSYNSEEASVIYALQAKQMKLLGIHMNLAPVAETQIEYNRTFLSRRSFGSSEKTMVYGTQCVRAYESNGIASVVKHFPGNSNTDPHVGLPVISISKMEFDNHFILPFAFVINSGNPTCVLMSHAIVDGYGNKTPACLSEFWIAEVLKERIGFDGIVISDDIFMSALAENGFPPEKAVIKAIDAGVDVLMLSEKKFLDAAVLILEEAKSRKEFRVKVETAVKRVINMKLDKCIASGLTRSERLDEFRRIYSEGQSYER